MIATSAAAVLDTSVFIASETGRYLDEARIPDEVATTVVTLAELHAGVLAATTSDIRAQRLATLESIADMETLSVDDDAARMWARLRIYLAEAGRRMLANDLWIAAIAASRGLAIVTQDDDFAALDGARNVTIIRV
ncbi:type II toxin-antitoxin system VapC family toxin [Mycobacterium sp. 94-17]|uniref:type II toxin-antitoxin system VapC family toxin n=1 Tax=Mycobacterium sp. 94-17 TaxID=2986147 RepID=UPI002D1ECE1D|nr:type II toxin-antitoxin system VapC family toxin [Mycobacterium sp. 94-17]MEB4211451.1 type II toxin-antitoxin system VapC family toxin [Mycobacterium sp. 94-17]